MKLTPENEILESVAPEDTRLSAAQAVVKHLRDFGTNAKVLLLARDQKAAELALEGPDGLLTLYGDELSGATLVQYVHSAGGFVGVHHVQGVLRQNTIGGQLFTMLWCEGLNIGGNEDDYHAYIMAASRNRLGLPKGEGGYLIMAHEGYFDPEGGPEGRNKAA